MPENCQRASSQATASPTGRLAKVAQVATLRLSWIAVHSSGDHGEEAACPMTVKPCFSKAARGLGAAQKVQEVPRRRGWSMLGQGDRDK